MNLSAEAAERLSNPNLKKFERWGTVHYVPDEKGALFWVGNETTACGLVKENTPDNDSRLKYVTCKRCLKSLINN